MQTAAIGIGHVPAQDAPETPAASGFAEALSVAQSGAPPGPEPPPDKAMEAGAVTQQPNAGAQTLHLFPKDSPDGKISLAAGVIPADLLQHSAVESRLLLPSPC